MGPRSAALLLALSLALSSTAYAQELVLGNRPPTPEEQAYIDAKYTETSSVAPNRLAWDRERAEIAAARARGDTVPRADGLPALVDNSTLQYFPQPDWQNHNDCTCWTACYYYNTYTQAADEGYDVTSLDTDHICSPAFMYPLVNGGLDSGANLQFVMGRLTDVGCASLTLAPDSSSDFTSWPTEAAWVDALRNRTQSAQFVDGSTAAGLDAIKQHLANGNLAATAFGLHANFDDYYPYDTTGIDSEVYYCPDGDQRTTHTGALVGYDDDKTYVDHRDGETHFGAFLVANSLGNLFGVQNSTGTGTKGFFWVAYAMFTESTFGPEVYYNDDRDDYRPRLYAVAGVNHSARGSLCLSGGTGPTPIPSWTSYYAIYEDGGTALAVDDTRRIAVDLSEGVTPGPTLDVFVRLHVALWAFANGTISSADFYSDFDRDGVYTVTTSADPTVVVGFGGAGYATASLPTIPGAVIHVKLDGSDAADGLTWGAAKQTVQAGLDACYAGDEVWVAAGIHVQPSINLRAGVALYGGFDGTETEREQRDWRSNVTVLDANYAGPVVVV
ncbi:MAG: hypothetical protein KAX80_03105, partial [Planctomycetes bacterium]|nr:hypothetical protein [Planctomycetota bacterium]